MIWFACVANVSLMCVLASVLCVFTNCGGASIGPSDCRMTDSAHWRYKFLLLARSVAVSERVSLSLVSEPDTRVFNVCSEAMEEGIPG